MALSQKLFDAIVDGQAQLAESLVEEELRAGADPVALISETMIPAMDEVGKLFQEESFSFPSCCLPDGR
jgi:5-methyltetrahydrofolate--homocysteine methyltransferase